MRPLTSSYMTWSLMPPPLDWDEEEEEEELLLRFDYTILLLSSVVSYLVSYLLLVPTKEDMSRKRDLVSLLILW